MEQPWKDYVLPLLVRPLAQGDVRGVSLLLIAEENQIPNRVTAEVKAVLEQVSVWGFEYAQIDRLAREYGVYQQLSAEETAVVKMILSRSHGRVPASVLGKLEEVFQQLAQGG